MKIGVYGLGRFGYFWAELLSEKFDVYAYNRSPGRAVPPTVTRCSLEELGDCDAIFLCVSISSLEPVVKALCGYVSDHTVVIDTCSVKSYPVTVMEQYLPGDVRYIATHPMFGPDSAKDGVRGLPLVYCSGRCEDEDNRFWLETFRSYGMRVLEMTPEEHDREAAYTQGITHFIGRVLNELHLKPSQIGTVGYNRLLEIVEQTCNDPLQLFHDLQRYNAFTHEMRLTLRGSIEHTMYILTQADPESAGE